MVEDKGFVETRKNKFEIKHIRVSDFGVIQYLRREKV